MLTLPGYSSHQNVLVYRETRQSLAAIAARAVVTTTGVDGWQHPCQELLLGIHQELLKPVFVDRAELKAFVVPLGESSKGRTRLPPHHDVVGLACSRFRHAVFNAHCTAGSTTTHSLSGRLPTLSIAFAPWVPSRIMRSTVPLVHALLATENR